jgi:hypothetical protein
MTREHAALAVIEQALIKALLQLDLAHSAAQLCRNPLSREVAGLIAHTTELRQRVVNENRLVAAAAADQIDNA